jgi:hypothetical protein
MLICTRFEQPVERVCDAKTPEFRDMTMGRTGGHIERLVGNPIPAIRLHVNIVSIEPIIRSGFELRSGSSSQGECFPIEKAALP